MPIHLTLGYSHSFRQQSEHEITKSFKVILDTPVTLEDVQNSEDPYQKSNTSL